MPEFVSGPKRPWEIELCCSGSLGCRNRYRYFPEDVCFTKYGDEHKRFWVRCGNCSRLLSVDPPIAIQKQAWDFD